MPPANRRRARLALVVGGALLLLLASAWLALIAHPHPLFAHHTRVANLVLHAREPLPAEARAQLEDVLRRVARSPLYDARREHHIFLCDTHALFRLLTTNAPGGGLTNPWGHVFIRPADVERGVVFDSAGRPKRGDRSLVYFMAHEITHALVFARWSARHNNTLVPFQREGYADYVAMARPVDLAAGRASMQRNEPEMDTGRSGLYRRYELLAAYLLDRQHYSVELLLGSRLDPKAVEAQLLADDGL